MWEGILTEMLLNALLFVLIPAIGSLLVAGVRYGLPFLVLKLADNKLAFVLKWVNKMVKAAEQKWNAPGMGETKKTFVSKIIKKIVETLKLKFDAEEIDALIEASVKELNATAADVVKTTVEETETKK